MTIFDAIIIYLALGAPIAVNRLLENPRWSARDFGRALLAGIFWFCLIPSFSHRNIKDLLKRRKQAEDFEIKADRMILLAQTVDSASRSSSSYPGVFQLRDSVERYLGVSSILAERSDYERTPPEALFHAVSHPDPATASVCLHRRNRAVIERHRSDAAHELVKSCCRIAEGSDHPSSITDAFQCLFEATGDMAAIRKLSEIRAEIGESVLLNEHRELERPTWETTAIFPQPKELTVGVSDLTLMSSLQRED